MLSKKQLAIEKFYQLHDILGDRALLICLNDHFPTKNMKTIIKDITNLTLTGYLEIFEYLLSQPYLNLKHYKNIVNLDLSGYISIFDSAITDGYTLPINLNEQLKTLEILIKRLRDG